MLIRCLICLSLLLPSALRAEAVTVFAAASLKTALEEIAESYPGDLRFSYAGSSVLARQVALGAPADVVLLANTQWMDWLEVQGAVVPESRDAIVGNELVLVGNRALGRKLDPALRAEAFGSDRIAMALVEAVPAGIYGRQALEHLGLWTALRPQVVQTDNVRAALALVALGEAPLGIVYASDARAELRVEILARFDAASHDPILYPGALTRDAIAEAKGFLDHLRSEEARAIFAAQGFTEVRP